MRIRCRDEIRDYQVIFADDHHIPITTMGMLKKSRWLHSLSLLFNGQFVGDGTLAVKNLQKKHLNTVSVHLDRKFRRKGHGIPLYMALIQAARSLGAARLYSSSSLNKYSTRMWSKKLPEIYTVKTTRKICKRPCSHCRQCGFRYYINL